MTKDITIQTKWQALEWGKMFISYTCNGGLISEIYKENFKKP